MHAVYVLVVHTLLVGCGMKGKIVMDLVYFNRLSTLFHYGRGDICELELWFEGFRLRAELRVSAWSVCYKSHL